MLNHPARLAAVRSRMDESNVGLLFLNAGANLFYLTGLERLEPHATEVNRYGDWVAGAYLGLDPGITLVSPNLGASHFQDQVSGKPWFDDLRILHESQVPAAVLAQVLQRFDLRDRRIAIDDHCWAQTVLAFRRLLPDTEFVLASEIVAPLRMIKDGDELAIMRKAGEITGAAFRAALARLRLGVSELDILSEIDYQFKALGAEYTSFVTDVSFTGQPGEAAGPLPRSQQRLAPGDSVTFDMGCVFEGYCSDFGRCAFAGDPPAEYLHIHATVLNAQREAMSAMVAGQVTGAQVNRIGRAVIEAAGYGAYFTHRLGHGIGVSVHEPPWLDVVEQGILQANMTFTVEPSVRVPGKWGNRVEDVVVVTEAGAVSLYDIDHGLYTIP